VILNGETGFVDAVIEAHSLDEAVTLARSHPLLARGEFLLIFDARTPLGRDYRPDPTNPLIMTVIATVRTDPAEASASGLT
jgi:hypothetical protein